MKTLHLPASSFKTAVWSGGTSTELFIFPPTAKYTLRDFSFRLSTATVEVETSEFTALPGFHRKLMVLDDATTLMHENHHQILLNKFEQDAFEGHWKTTSAGKCTDFNLMTRGKTTGKISAVSLQANESFEKNLSEETDWFFIYAFKGAATIFLNSTTFTLQKGDVFVIKNPEDLKFIASPSAKTELIFSEIHVF